MRILILDDDPGIMDVLSMIFTGHGMQVSSFTDGDIVLANAFELPDVFLIDKQLPGVDGLDICRHLRSQPSTQNIPIIIISASPYARREGLQAGANAFIEKPFSNKELVQLVNDILEKKAR